MSLEEVLRRDDQFRADAAKEVLDPGSEALALREMFEGASRELAETACTQTLNAQRWGACCQSWGAWRDQQQGMELTVADCAINMHCHVLKRILPCAALGSAVKGIVEDLEADHLRPSGTFSLE